MKGPVVDEPVRTSTTAAMEQHDGWRRAGTPQRRRAPPEARRRAGGEVIRASGTSGLGPNRHFDATTVPMIRL